ncbi:MAG: gamma-glutamyl-gamma-aminobutyrate hydrolase [Phycisphaerales bacterium]|nr:gamma-glutamyl-gamma-aminobutyrate hydrolase [Phycisphaerales bacterium]
MKKPIIGITMDSRDDGSYYQLGFDYAKAVETAGGVPLGIPYKVSPALIPAILDTLDGILFTVGNDLDPALYGEEWHPKAQRIDPDRQSFELALLAEVEKRRLPALAICLGCQLFNVYRGGSLYQFLPDVADKHEHRRGEDSIRRHAIKVEPDSALGRMIGKGEISANTYHKQAVKTVGRGLRVTAVSDDGIVEGLEDPSLPLFAAVQWHPERLHAEAEHLAPFRLLVEKASQTVR